MHTKLQKKHKLQKIFKSLWEFLMKRKEIKEREGGGRVKGEESWEEGVEQGGREERWLCQAEGWWFIF